MSEDSGGMFGWLDGAVDKLQDSASDLWDSVTESEIAKINDKLSDKGGVRAENVYDQTPAPSDPAGPNTGFVDQYKTPLMIGAGILLLGGMAYMASK